MTTSSTKIRNLLDQAHDIGYAAIERRARKLMKDHKNLTGFVMCMGTAFFTDKDGPIDDQQYKYLTPFYNFLYEFDSELHLTGSPLKLDAWNGPIIKDW